jgi:hypothetical protein
VQIIDAGNLFGFGFGIGERRQEHGGQDCNNGNYDQQLD